VTDDDKLRRIREYAEKLKRMGQESIAIKIPGKRDDQPTAAGAQAMASAARLFVILDTEPSAELPASPKLPDERETRPAVKDFTPFQKWWFGQEYSVTHPESIYRTCEAAFEAGQRAGSESDGK
jgi:hypothetical protein